MPNFHDVFLNKNMKIDINYVVTLDTSKLVNWKKLKDKKLEKSKNIIYHNHIWLEQ